MEQNSMYFGINWKLILMNRYKDYVYLNILYLLSL
jgi:hypothetical protein